MKEGDVIEAYEVEEVAREHLRLAGCSSPLQRFDLRIPGSRSLKQKRHVVKSLTAALRRRSR